MFMKIRAIKIYKTQAIEQWHSESKYMNHP